MKMKRGQGLPISTVVIVAAAIAVAAVFLIYIFSSSGRGFGATETFFGFGGNLTENASVQAGQPPSGGAISTCKNTGQACGLDSDCCDAPNAKCFSTNINDYNSGRKTCSFCVPAGGFCSSTNNCCSGSSCQNNNPVSASSACG